MRQCRHARGFTLLEILVALMLMSFIMTGLASSLFSLAQTETRVDRRLEADNRFRAAMHFLDQALGRVSYRQRPGVLNVEESQYWFDGQEQQVRWVGVMPARYGAGGRYFFQLGVESSGGGGNLVIRFAPWSDVPDFPDPANMEGRVLLTDVSQFSLRYRGESSETMAWSPQWRRTDFMPSHVMVNAATLEMPLPLKIVALREATGSTFGDSLFSVGGNSARGGG